MTPSPEISPRDRERERLRQLPQADSADLRHSGVLLADEIERCCRKFALISPFSEQQLKPASYRLTVGSRCSLGGERKTLTDGDPITIPPFQVVVIETRETLNLPRDLIARWNIKVKLAYEGLIWAGGPQVDPGYQGHLFCPIYNLSRNPVTLAYGDEVAVIDFVATTPFSVANRYLFLRPPKDILFDDYRTFETGLSEAWEKIQGFDSKLTVYMGVAFTVIGILIAALSIMVAGDHPLHGLTLADWSCLAFSLGAFALSAWAFLRNRGRRDERGGEMAMNLVMVLVGIFLGSLIMFLAVSLNH
jgi:deoxycytidine triphosphate deaminase